MASSNPGFGLIDWQTEAEAVINDINKHVRIIFISNKLPINENGIYINCETIENEKYTIRLSTEGYQVVGKAFDSSGVNGEIICETPYALLNQISPGYISSFGNALSEALRNLEQK